MTFPLQVIDAFTEVPFRGNPAAVVRLDVEQGDEWMQAVAAEMRHSETAFLRARGDGDFDLRWFTPETEVDLCGHATLASAHALWDWGTLDVSAPARFNTKSGLLSATRDDDLIDLDFPAVRVSATEPPTGLFDALGLNGGDDVVRVSAGEFYLVVEVSDPSIVRGLQPNFAALLDVKTRATLVTARGDDGYDIVSRVFGPRVGIPEDPVTGSAHCALAPYWEPRLGPELRAYQASARGGTMRTRLDGDRVHLAGTAVTVLRATLAA
jgi:PhzF family phenazine biosynthesis protein